MYEIKTLKLVREKPTSKYQCRLNDDEQRDVPKKSADIGIESIYRYNCVHKYFF